MSRRFWSEGDLQALRTLYPSLPTKEVARRLARSMSSVYGMAGLLGLAKSQAFLDSTESGRLRKGETRPGSERTQFQKGLVPFNKGLRRPGWSPGRMRETQFKKGARTGAAARNWVPVGTIRIDNEGYQRIKVRDAWPDEQPTGFGNTKIWPLLNRHVWEQHKGPIPPKHIVIFKDEDRQNCAIENLELLSMADNARRNSMWSRMPRELAEVMQLNGALKRKLRRSDGQEQNHRSA